MFGFIYNDFLDELGVGTAAVTVVFGVFQVTLAVAGKYETSFLLGLLSIRYLSDCLIYFNYTRRPFN